jgi:hypothetical protein
MSKPASIGRVTSYAAARLFPRAGSNHTAEEIFLDYVQWCARSRHVPLRDGVFRERFAELARTTGIPRHAEWADVVYLDVALGEP